MRLRGKQVGSLSSDDLQALIDNRVGESALEPLVDVIWQSAGGASPRGLMSPHPPVAHPRRYNPKGRSRPLKLNTPSAILLGSLVIGAAVIVGSWHASPNYAPFSSTGNSAGALRLDVMTGAIDICVPTKVERGGVRIRCDSVMH